ncbi:unnamed protein product [Thlaspi arvense]|uniref:Calcineurin-like phosphoesterase domain-containing protein n=1 Tax=Thlaspi arvense TaxID=13288 RepID=A0AAU9SRG1_THLAR|nr:unnamed protein product [Thlaspi arvense]
MFLVFFFPRNNNSGLSFCAPMASSSLVRIAVVGDIHGFWDLDEDRKALRLLQPHLVLFTGSFSVILVRKTCHLCKVLPLFLSLKQLYWAIMMLGTPMTYQRNKIVFKCSSICEFDHCLLVVRIALSFFFWFPAATNSLGDEHVGYQRMDFPSYKLSIVGGRPFSHGGDRLFRQKLLFQRYGVHDMDSSAGRICRAAHGTPEDHVVIILAHNGPTGLGSQAENICGRDWFVEGGDHGDPDLEKAIRQLKETTKLSVPLVVFGHMHKELQSGKGDREMVVQDSDNQTVYVNGAVVPRVKGTKEENCGRGIGENETSSESGGTVRVYTLVEILDGKIKKVAESWVQVIGTMAKIVEEKTLFEDVT